MVRRCMICYDKRSKHSSVDRICNDCLAKLNIFRDGVKKIIETMDPYELTSIIDKFYWTALELIKIRKIPIE